MTTTPRPEVCSVALLAAALVLKRTHGERYASYFLQERGFSDEVIEELLSDPVSPGQAK